MRQFITITKALADENRVRALMLLGQGELCLCQIIEMLGLAPSTVSKHITVLRQARLVEIRKKGRWCYYRLAGRDAPKAAREAIHWVQKTLSGEKKILKDAKRLKVVVRIDTEELCRHYRKRGAKWASNYPARNGSKG